VIVIDQAKIDAPNFPRSLEWWCRFAPVWADVAVHGDGTVTLTANDLEPFYTAEHGLWYTSPAEPPAAAQRRRRERSLEDWARRIPRLAAGIVQAVLLDSSQDRP
jgi:hypothetical protein